MIRYISLYSKEKGFDQTQNRVANALNGKAYTALQLGKAKEVMKFALRYGGNRTYAGGNPGLLWSQTLTTRSTLYIRLVPHVPGSITSCNGNIRYQSYIYD